MRSIERKFKKIEEKHPEWSSYICFAETISGQGFSEDRVKRMFNKLVDKEEYAQDEKRAIVKYLLSLNEPLSVQKTKVKLLKVKIK